MTLPDFLVEAPDGDIRLLDHRIGLLHLVHYYNEGFSPEMLAGQYPTLPLALVHKVIAFYLENHAEVDDYAVRCRAELARQRVSYPHAIDMETLRQRLETLRRADMLGEVESA